jgi:hypothetical protein
MARSAATRALTEVKIEGVESGAPGVRPVEDDSVYLGLPRVCEWTGLMHDFLLNLNVAAPSANGHQSFSGEHHLRRCTVDYDARTIQGAREWPNELGRCVFSPRGY